jgi:hypothetical protein
MFICSPFFERLFWGYDLVDMITFFVKSNTNYYRKMQLSNNFLSNLEDLGMRKLGSHLFLREISLCRKNKKTNQQHHHP